MRLMGEAATGAEGDESVDALEEAYSQERRELLEEFCALPDIGDVLLWQRRLADAIMRAETESTGPSRYIAKRHRHLLRVIGDALVHALLPSHTIRALSRAPGKPPHLSSQGDDLDFVFDRAAKAQAKGFVPILADLTTLIGIGDLVLVADGGVAVLECKNRPAVTAALRGRLARQQQRGENLEKYLSTSRINEGDIERVAIEHDLPQPDYELLERLLVECLESPAGIAVHKFDDRDALIACTETADQDELSALLQTVLPDNADNTKIGMAFIDELVESASHRRLSPSSYPLAADLRWRLLERELHLVRIIDIDGLACEKQVGDLVLRLVPRRGDTGLEVHVEGLDAPDHLAFTSEIVEMCLWTPTPVADVRRSLVEQTLGTISELNALGEDEDLRAVNAPGDRVVYGIAYRDEPNTD